MATRPFRFKQFTIHQEEAPFKVGTDGALLGAWVRVANGQRILDIGTGTGLIALMLKQRANLSEVIGLEIQKKAADQARFNVDQSPWKEVQIVHKSLQDFQPEAPFDVIVCNPPFFKPSTLSGNIEKDLSRQNLTLDLSDLFAFAENHLTNKGRLSLVLPTEREPDLIECLNSYSFYIQREARMKPTPGAPVKRIFLECSRQKTTLESIQFVLEDSGRHGYSDQVREWLGDFYLSL